ncbi:MAG: PIN domain-containing protein [Candidatus Bathyarchaeota archaeon]|nr:PIN domain-containing protein [Candidatus Bathyarchaeota archaeon]MDH5745387.1 PIN domain-containing protein [Candidatus Bathyarchaeota archaeon]
MEADLLYASLDPKDDHHQVARKLLSLAKRKRLADVKIDSLALHELELNLKTGNILIEKRKATLEDIAKFFTDLSQLLSLYKLSVYPLTCQQIAKAANLRKKHNLTFYDSHHAASAMLYDSKIISTDNTYDSVIGLKRLNPYSIK